LEEFRKEVAIMTYGFDALTPQSSQSMQCDVFLVISHRDDFSNFTWVVGGFRAGSLFFPPPTSFVFGFALCCPVIASCS
jgi:hypothetical protein